MGSSHLNTAKVTKNDEYYTRYDDIHTMMSYYKDYLKGKSVYCNCDTPESNFVRYFKDNFNEYQLSRLIATHYDTNGSYAYIYDGEEHIIPLNGTGDFRSKECVGYADEADIIITNPPFSLFMDYITMMCRMKKQFIIVGALTGIASTRVFPHIMRKDISICGTTLSKFDTPHGDVMDVACVWYTTLSPQIRKVLELKKDYDISKYDRYVNCNAIDVSSLKDIPDGYKGIIGVPITFLLYQNIDDYHIIGCNKIAVYSSAIGVRPLTKEEARLVPKNSLRNGFVYLKDGNRFKFPFFRMFIIHR